MDFHSYTRLISESVAECGYDEFLPSLCVPGGTLEFEVLAVALQPEGERDVATKWATTFTAPGQVLYCAYRNGGGQVEVIEVTGDEITQITQLGVSPKAT